MLTFSDCNYFSGIEKDPVASSVINIIKSAKLTGPRDGVFSSYKGWYYTEDIIY